MTRLTPPPPLTLVLVHRDRSERCVRTGRAFLEQDGVALRLVVVDNGSAPGQLAAVREGLPEAEVLALGANRGFGPAANAGFTRWLAAADPGAGEWVGVAPHDVLPDPGCLRRILDAVADRSRVGLVSAEFGEDLVPVVDPYFGGIQVPAERGEGYRRAGYPHGSLMLARRGCLEAIGLFDERYFAYCEEADLAVRARRRGWEVGIVWGARVRNTDLSTGLATIDYLKLRNSLLLVRAHYGRYHSLVRVLFAATDTVRGLVHPARRSPEFDVPARIRAVRDFVARRFGPPPELSALADRAAPRSHEPSSPR